MSNRFLISVSDIKISLRLKTYCGKSILHLIIVCSNYFQKNKKGGMKDAEFLQDEFHPTIVIFQINFHQILLEVDVFTISIMNQTSLQNVFQTGCPGKLIYLENSTLYSSTFCFQDFFSIFFGSRKNLFCPLNPKPTFANQSNSLPCAIQASISFWACSATMLWSAALIFNLHLTVVWKCQFLNFAKVLTHAICWFLPIPAVVFAIYNNTIQFYFGTMCNINVFELGLYFFVPFGVVTIPTILVHLYTTIFMIKNSKKFITIKKYFAKKIYKKKSQTEEKEITNLEMHVNEITGFNFIQKRIFLIIFFVVIIVLTYTSYNVKIHLVIFELTNIAKDEANLSVENLRQCYDAITKFIESSKFKNFNNNPKYQPGDVIAMDNKVNLDLTSNNLLKDSEHIMLKNTTISVQSSSLESFPYQQSYSGATSNFVNYKNLNDGETKDEGQSGNQESSSWSKETVW
ncbi:hypothetical protein HK099_007513 [Clydaea vesicula]|uniref:G-protein coupled receptors family 2 profile 2 domain-containing protein n=1 Tax=Clydaea vesicula TaxID=447962 RepID=A0AAD5TYV8_9FUNG|nr:hypothetical protein HK099_007513 [Clydaea vesicula]